MGIQVHQAAVNARNCDFIVLEKVNESTLLDLPKKSNAAYFYSQEDSKLYYVNSVEEERSVVEVNDKRIIESFIGKLNAINAEETNSCFVREYLGEELFGLTLRGDELTELTEAINHQHQTRDYPIVFDYYDDRKDILDAIASFFANSLLLPKNVALRLTQYDENSRRYLREVDRIIQGSGNINPNSSESLRKLTREKFNFTNQDEFSFNSVGKCEISQALMERQVQVKLNEQATLSPLIKVSRKTAKQHLLSDFSPTKNQIELMNYAQNRRDNPFEYKTVFFSHGFSKTEKLRAASALLNSLNSGHKILPQHIPVLQQGELGRLSERCKVDVESLEYDVYQDESLNQMSADEKALLGALEQYKKERHLRSFKQHTNFFALGFSKQEKFSAVNVLILAIKEQNLKLDVSLKKIFENGQLAQLLARHKVQIEYMDYSKRNVCSRTLGSIIKLLS